MNQGGQPIRVPEHPDVSGLRIGIVYTQWNFPVIERLLKGATEALSGAGIPSASIIKSEVPGSVELPLGAQWLLESKKPPDGIICLGVVIRGDTTHYDYVCNMASTGILNVSLKFSVPIAFGVLTVENEEQAYDRAGGRMGNKGAEAAETVLAMALLKKAL